MFTGIVFRGDSSPTFRLIVDLRCLCWKGALPDLDQLNDGHDGHAFHFALFYCDAVIAAARLCVHESLTDVPDPHLFANANIPVAAPFGCINRLVVHPEYRGLGIAAIFDLARTEAAKRLGCNTMLVIWNEHSNIQRRNAIDAQGFTSLNNGKAVADGEWGYSYPFARWLSNDSINEREPINLNEQLQVFTEQLRGLLASMNLHPIKKASFDEV